MRKKIWIRLTDYVLYSVRDYEDKKVDIIHTYKDDEVKQLIRLNELTEIKEDYTINNIEDYEIIFDDI